MDYLDETYSWVSHLAGLVGSCSIAVHDYYEYYQNLGRRIVYWLSQQCISNFNYVFMSRSFGLKLLLRHRSF
ncbi:hypothetical protein FRX31_010880 [Thalictrum thalictroides]|uniref:Uncharacterized protein n=1 Tax=Thalictrum thalictroides TaxID=46969 RepID=A0A7J6WRE7_THATH|nr:hypothetical protein FRX31_010880 [Thalictrum thalictroides]